MAIRITIRAIVQYHMVMIIGALTESRIFLFEITAQSGATALVPPNTVFACGNHVLYCPNLSSVDDSRPFFLYCPSHDIMYEINLPTQGAEFIREFPNGTKASIKK